jgi:hypothetical protein
VRALQTVAVTAEEIGFPGARQIGQLRTRVRGGGRRVKETRYLITSATPERLDALGLLEVKRGYWAIEAKLHTRLDEVLDEDESRVRRGPAAHILGMCRRLVVSFACEWLRREKGDRKHSRKSTRHFQEHLEANDRAPAFALITAAHPTAWLPT